MTITSTSIVVISTATKPYLLANVFAKRYLAPKKQSFLPALAAAAENNRYLGAPVQRLPEHAIFCDK